MKNNKQNQNKCYTCQYRGTIPGDCHSCCHYPGTSTGLLDFFNTDNLKLMVKLNIKANQHGIDNGWFMWPVNFDPVWLINCDGYKAKETINDTKNTVDNTK